MSSFVGLRQGAGKLLALTLLASAMAACSQDDAAAPNAAASNAALADASLTLSSAAAVDAVPVANSTAAWVDCGAAPSGEYTASVIPTTILTGEFQGLYEGPVWVKDALYYSHFSFERGFPSRILRLGDKGIVSVMVKASGSNGLSLDHEGNLVAASHAVKGLLRFDRTSGDQQILVDSYNGNPFNSPNDLVFTGTGVAYFTDPDFQKAAAPGGQPVTGVYQVIDKTVTLIDASIRNPNGILLSADERKLYVVGGEDKGLLREYTLSDNKVIGQRDLVTDLHIPDGMALDCRGNIYVTEHVNQRVRIFTAEGEQIATIVTDANVTNAAFGGVDGKTLYLTGAGSVWTVPLTVTGAVR